MEYPRKIDNSLTERHAILHLLEKLKEDGITLAEMEEIGGKLRKSGKRALSPLVRRLWREKNGELISKYTYLLDFFDDEVWIDQLIQIALRRRDLEEDGKAALLAVLQENGVDVSLPPLAKLLAREEGPLRETLPRLLDQGEEGLVSFMQDFFLMSQEGRLAVVRELPQLGEPRIVGLLEILLGIDDPEINEEVVTALGRVRSSGSAALLQQLLGHQDAAVRESAARSLRRLSFLGIESGESSPLSLPLPFYAAYASPIDGAGFRAVWIAWSAKGGLVSSLYLQLHETEGIRSAWGSGEITVGDFSKHLAESSCEEGILEIPPEYALSLVRDAIFRNRQEGGWLPPEFYVWRRLFAPLEIAPKQYTPIFKGYDLVGLAVSARHIARTPTLFDDDYFASWVLANDRVCDYAEEWIELEKSADPARLAKGMESLLEKFCENLLVPGLESIIRRLFLNADMMHRTCRDRDLVELTLAAALSLAAPRFQGPHHPFLKRLALESMDLAREALAEGYDLRGYDGDEWEE